MTDKLTSETLRALADESPSPFSPWTDTPFASIDRGALRAHADAMEKLEDALREIAKGEGCFSRDPESREDDKGGNLRSLAASGRIRIITSEDSPPYYGPASGARDAAQEDSDE